MNAFKKAKIKYRGHLENNKTLHFKTAVQSAKGDSRKFYAITMDLMGKTLDNPMPDSTQNDTDYFLNKIQKIRDALGMCLSINQGL